MPRNLENSPFEADPAALFHRYASSHWLEGGAFPWTISRVQEPDFPGITACYVDLIVPTGTWEKSTNDLKWEHYYKIK